MAHILWRFEGNWLGYESRRQALPLRINFMLQFQLSFHDFNKIFYNHWPLLSIHQTNHTILHIFAFYMIEIGWKLWELSKGLVWVWQCVECNHVSLMLAFIIDLFWLPSHPLLSSFCPNMLMMSKWLGRHSQNRWKRQKHVGKWIQFIRMLSMNITESC